MTSLCLILKRSGRMCDVLPWLSWRGFCAEDKNSCAAESRLSASCQIVIQSDSGALCLWAFLPHPEPLGGPASSRLAGAGAAAQREPSLRLFFFPSLFHRHRVTHAPQSRGAAARRRRVRGRASSSWAQHAEGAGPCRWSRVRWYRCELNPDQQSPNISWSGISAEDTRSIDWPGQDRRAVLVTNLARWPPRPPGTLRWPPRPPGTLRWTHQRDELWHYSRSGGIRVETKVEPPLLTALPRWTQARPRVHDSAARTWRWSTRWDTLEETEKPREDAGHRGLDVRIVAATCDMNREKTATEANDIMLVRSPVSAAAAAAPVAPVAPGSTG